MDYEEFYKFIMDYFYATAVEVETVFQILISNGVCTMEDIETTRKKVKESEKYKETYDRIKNL